MKKLISLSLAVALIAGCARSRPYDPTPLNENAKGITTVRATPYGCKVLGEVEGKEIFTNKRGIRRATNEEMIEGAMNDLRNKASDVVGQGKRITLYIIGEKGVCLDGRTCNPSSSFSQLKSYKVTAQIFECGDKK